MSALLIRRFNGWRFVPVARCQVTVASRPSPVSAVIAVDASEAPRTGDLVTFDHACWRLDGPARGGGWAARRVEDT